MKKFGIIKGELSQLATDNGLPDDIFKNCSGRAQLLAKVKSNFLPLYKLGVIDLAWLREYYSEEDLNRQQIYTTGLVDLHGEARVTYIIGDCHCVTTDTTVFAFDAALVKVLGTGKVYGYGHSQIEAFSHSRVEARDRCRVIAANFATVRNYDEAEVLASDYVRVFVESSGETTLKCHSTAFVSHPDAVVEAGGYSTIHYSSVGRISICECAVAVNNPLAEVTVGERLAYTRD